MLLSVLETTLIFTPAFRANALWLPARLTSERSNRMTSLRLSNRDTPSALLNKAKVRSERFDLVVRQFAGDADHRRTGGDVIALIPLF